MSDERKKYNRDKRSPKPKNENASKIMSANKAKNTKPELTLRKYMWQKGLKGYRVNYKQIPGKPDIAFVAKKIAVFVNGCFWHRCPKCNYGLPRSNAQFWENKFDANISRDKKKIEQLLEMGWEVLVVWECDIKKNVENAYLRIKAKLEQNNNE